VIVNVTKTADAQFAHDGDDITFHITAHNTGTDPLDGVTLHDQIVGTDPAHSCDSLSGPTGDAGNIGKLDPNETWTWVCTMHVVHAEENSDHYIVNVAWITGTTDTGRDAVESNHDTAQTLIIHPAITVVKTVQETSAVAGDTLHYTITVTNTGDTA